MTIFAKTCLEGGANVVISDYRAHNLGFTAKLFTHEVQGSFRIPFVATGHTPSEAVRKLACEKIAKRHEDSLLQLASQMERSVILPLRALT